MWIFPLFSQNNVELHQGFWTNAVCKKGIVAMSAFHRVVKNFSVHIIKKFGVNLKGSVASDCILVNKFVLN